MFQLRENIQGLASENSHLLEPSYSNTCTEMAWFLDNLENMAIVFSPNLFQSIAADTPSTYL